MNSNHDTNKQASNLRIRKSSRVALVITSVLFIERIIMTVARVIYTLLQPQVSDLASGGSILDFLQNRPISLIRNIIVPGLLGVASLLPLVLLFKQVSRDGIPFTAKNRKLLLFSAIMEGLLAILPVISTHTYNTFHGNFDLNSLFSFVVGGNGMNPFHTGACILLLFLAALLHYGMILQQESDETL